MCSPLHRSLTSIYNQTLLERVCNMGKFCLIKMFIIAAIRVNTP